MKKKSYGQLVWVNLFWSNGSKLIQGCPSRCLVWYNLSLEQCFGSGRVFGMRWLSDGVNGMCLLSRWGNVFDIKWGNGLHNLKFGSVVFVSGGGYM